MIPLTNPFVKERRRQVFSQTLLCVFFLIGGCTSPGPRQEFASAPPVSSSVKKTVEAEAVADPDTVVLDHQYFQVVYSKKHRLPKYVKYTVRAEDLRKNIGSREGNTFVRDPLLVSQGVEAMSTGDFKMKGFDRGHMAPAAAFKHSQEAVNTTFVTSNVVPQRSSFNRMAWKYLEELERRWGCGEKEISVYVGPILEEKMELLPSGLPIPPKLFRVVVDQTPPRKVTAFIYFQTDSQQQPSERIVNPKEVQKLVGENFESSVPEEDRAIFQKSAPLTAWKSENCSSPRAMARKSKRTSREAR